MQTIYVCASAVVHGSQCADGWPSTVFIPNADSTHVPKIIPSTSTAISAQKSIAFASCFIPAPPSTANAVCFPRQSHGQHIGITTAQKPVVNATARIRRVRFVNRIRSPVTFAPAMPMKLR